MSGINTGFHHHRVTGFKIIQAPAFETLKADATRSEYRFLIRVKGYYYHYVFIQVHAYKPLGLEGRGSSLRF
jgi:hypothetical protein